jgi:hypothetical protein
MAKPSPVDEITLPDEIALPVDVAVVVKKARKAAATKKKPKAAATKKKPKAKAKGPETVNAPALVAKLVDAAVPTASAMPTSFRAFTTLKVPGGWAFVELEVDTENMTVSDCRVSNPNVKAIVTEQFKIAVGRYWMKQEG